MISRFHARVAVLSMVTALAVSTLSAAQGEVATGTAATCSPVTGDVSAAQALAWGAPTWCAEFDDAVDPADWVFYDSPGHAGNGRRSPEQLYLGNGALYLYGRPDGTTAGLATKHAQTYGRWETRVRLYPGAGSYHPVVLLWPKEGGGAVRSSTSEEVDFLEVINDPERQRPNFFLAHPPGPGAGQRQCGHDHLAHLRRGEHPERGRRLPRRAGVVPFSQRHPQPDVGLPATGLVPRPGQRG